MTAINHAQKTLVALIVVFFAFSFSVGLLLAFYFEVASWWQIIIIVLTSLTCQLAAAPYVAKSIARKVIFEGRLKQRLKRLKRRFNDLEKSTNDMFNNISEGIIVLDESAKVQMANKAARRFFSAPQELHNLSLAQMVRAPELHDLLNQCQESRSAKSGLFLCESLGNRKFFAKIVPGQDKSVSIFITDVSEKSLVNEQHKDFIAHASHELKTPITVIKANAELLVSSNNDPLCQAILRQADKAKLLLDALLDLARMDSGRLLLSREEINLRDFVDDLDSSLGALDLVINNQVDEALTIVSDRSLLERLTLIVSENTKKYAGSGGILTIRAERKNDLVKIMFSDNGPGIRPHLRERIFEKFFRQPEHEESGQDGFGLGLARARSIASSLGGSINVEQGATKGCTLLLTIKNEQLNS